MGEIGCGCGGQMDGKTEGGDSGLQVLEVVGVGYAGEIEEKGVGCGEFEVGRDRLGECQKIVKRMGFEIRIAIEEMDPRAAGEGADE